MGWGFIILPHAGTAKCGEMTDNWMTILTTGHRPLGFWILFPLSLEKEMATHSSTLAWRISGTAEPGGLPSMGSHRVRHDWSDLAAAAAVPLSPHSPPHSSALPTWPCRRLSWNPWSKGFLSSSLMDTLLIPPSHFFNSPSHYPFITAFYYYSLFFYHSILNCLNLSHVPNSSYLLFSTNLPKTAPLRFFLFILSWAQYHAASTSRPLRMSLHPNLTDTYHLYPAWTLWDH